MTRTYTLLDADGNVFATGQTRAMAQALSADMINLGHTSTMTIVEDSDDQQSTGDSTRPADSPNEKDAAQ